MTTRMTVIYAGVDRLPREALEYLVLNLNTRQADVEFQFVPPPLTRPIKTLLPSLRVEAASLREKIPRAIEYIREELSQKSREHHLDTADLGRVLIVSDVALDTHEYLLRDEEYSAVFLGDWQDRTAPPSLLEIVLSLVMREGLLASVPANARNMSHLTTKGCIGDFSPTLVDLRHETLQGFLCSECAEVVTKAIGPERTQTWVRLLGMEWLGTTADPTSPVTVVSRLGYELFVTKGYAPTRWEQLVKALSQDGVDELLKLIALIILFLGVLLLLGRR